MWKLQRIFLIMLINYRKRKMLQVALCSGMASVEVLNESIVVDQLINRLNKLECKKGNVKFLNGSQKLYN